MINLSLSLHKTHYKKIVYYYYNLSIIFEICIANTTTTTYKNDENKNIDRKNYDWEISIRFLFYYKIFIIKVSLFQRKHKIKMKKTRTYSWH